MWIIQLLDLLMHLLDICSNTFLNISHCSKIFLSIHLFVKCLESNMLIYIQFKNECFKGWMSTKIAFINNVFQNKF